MRPHTSKIFAAGLMATLVNTLMMYFVSPYDTGPMEIALPLQATLGGSWIAGTIAHLVVGALVLPALFLALCYSWLPGGSAVRGVTWGCMLWVFAQGVVVPMTGGGVFSAWSGGITAILSSLSGHLAYGLCFGILAGVPQRVSQRYARAFRHVHVGRAG